MLRAAFIFVIFMCVTASRPIEPFHPHHFVSSETRCLTEAIYRESPDESHSGQLAVGTVIVNRLHSKGFPKTICGVIYAKGQFSWTALHLHRPDAVLYARARNVAMEILHGTVLADVHHATYFHNMSVNPRWDHVRFVTTIGNHVFYESTP